MTDDTEKPPAFSTWGHWYALVIAILLIVIMGLYLFSAWFS